MKACRKLVVFGFFFFFNVYFVYLFFTAGKQKLTVFAVNKQTKIALTKRKLSLYQVGFEKTFQVFFLLSGAGMKLGELSRQVSKVLLTIQSSKYEKWKCLQDHSDAVSDLPLDFNTLILLSGLFVIF